MDSGGNIWIMTKSARDMINAHLFPILALIATASCTSIALSLLPIAASTTRWNSCYDVSQIWLQRNLPNLPEAERPALSTNYCNGGQAHKGKQ